MSLVTADKRFFRSLFAIRSSPRSVITPTLPYDPVSDLANVSSTYCSLKHVSREHAGPETIRDRQEICRLETITCGYPFGIYREV